MLESPTCWNSMGYVACYSVGGDHIPGKLLFKVTVPDHDNPGCEALDGVTIMQHHDQRAAKAHQRVLELLACFEIEMVHRSEEHTSELQSRENLVCRLLLE